MRAHTSRRLGPHTGGPVGESPSVAAGESPLFRGRSRRGGPSCVCGRGLCAGHPAPIPAVHSNDASAAESRSGRASGHLRAPPPRRPHRRPRPDRRASGSESLPRSAPTSGCRRGGASRLHEERSVPPGQICTTESIARLCHIERPRARGPPPQPDVTPRLPFPPKARPQSETCASSAASRRDHRRGARVSSRRLFLRAG